MIDPDDVLMAATRDWDLPEGEPQWRQSLLALKVADLLAQVAVGDRLRRLPAEDREWFKDQTDDLVTNAVTRYAVLKRWRPMITPVLGERVLLLPQVWAVLTNPHRPEANCIGKDPNVVVAVGARHGDHCVDAEPRPSWETFTSTLLRTGYGVMVVREGVLFPGPARWDSGD